MLSYDAPLSPNGQAPTSPTSMSTHRQAIATSPKASRTAPSVVANGIKTTGAALTNSHRDHETKKHHIWLVTGPAGCGKSTVAKHIANTLNLPFIEGDEFHPPANIEKMAHGIPLTDADRDVIRVAPYFSRNVQLHFIYLHAPESVLLQRVAARKGHYMGANMVHSQFEALEPPTEAETDVISIDVSRSVEEIEQETLSKVLEKMDEKRDDEN
ncbi:hypothetical protein NKR23_g7421 [Pleurostoma richardsiae]|uniref:gluconokinase n=1 Tax=Pleurostoma richardsiae TaxID=41990 RepID=A0AA38RN22_9PEZI|nr:hypothetical protein NKR23_g7421 [Pleurostoma richardsiae]